MKTGVASTTYTAGMAKKKAWGTFSGFIHLYRLDVVIVYILFFLLEKFLMHKQLLLIKN